MGEGQRVVELKMPYDFEKPMFPMITKPFIVPIEDKDDLQSSLSKIEQERDD